MASTRTIPLKRKRTVKWKLRLYVMGTSSVSQQAVGILTKLCESRIPGGYDLEVVDIQKQPERAEKENIIAVPMLVRLDPMPQRRILGDLFEPERMARGLDLPLRDPIED